MAKKSKAGAEASPKRMAADNRHDVIARNVLLLPDVRPINLATFDAKDPDTRYPPIRSYARPPERLTF